MLAVMPVKSGLRSYGGLRQRYSAEGVGKGISVAQYFESNGVPYHTFEKWYKKKYSQSGIVDCVVSSESDGSLQVSGGGKSGLSNTDKRGDVYVSYVNIGLSNGIYELIAQEALG